MKDPYSRPAIKYKRDNMDAYKTVFVGFPIWCYDFSGKIVILFATSGGSGMGEIYERILPSCKGAKLIEGKVFSSNTSKSELSAWVAGLNI